AQQASGEERHTGGRQHRRQEAFAQASADRAHGTGILAVTPARRSRSSVLVPSRRMKSAVTIIAGLATGILLAVGILAALVFVGPDPIGLQPTPSPLPSIVAQPSASAATSAAPVFSAAPSAVPSFSAAPSASL